MGLKYLPIVFVPFGCGWSLPSVIIGMVLGFNVSGVAVITVSCFIQLGVGLVVATQENVQIFSP